MPTYSPPAVSPASEVKCMPIFNTNDFRKGYYTKVKPTPGKK